MRSDSEIRLGLKPELGTSKRPHLFEPIVEDTDAHLRFVELHLQSPPERRWLTALPYQIPA